MGSFVSLAKSGRFRLAMYGRLADVGTGTGTCLAIVVWCRGPEAPKGMLGMEGMCPPIGWVWYGLALPSATWVVLGFGIALGIPGIALPSATWVTLGFGIALGIPGIGFVETKGGMTPILGMPMTGGGPVLGIPICGVLPILGIPKGVAVAVDGTTAEGSADV
jgi:hypothetical protein